MNLIDRTAKPLPRFQLMRLAKTNTDRRFYFQTTKRGTRPMRNQTACITRPVCPVRSRKSRFARFALVGFVALAIIGRVGATEPGTSAPVRIFEDCSFAPAPGHALPSGLVAVNALPDNVRYTVCESLVPNWEIRFN
jgi:hypothetical protein